MTPGARVAAAIEILDLIAQGTAAEQVLTRWGRANRFAGSKDRAAIRDHVFDVLRRYRSTAHFGGAETGRGRMIGLLKSTGLDPSEYFNGIGHAPAPLDPAEKITVAPPKEPGVVCDLPDWILPHFEQSLGPKTAQTARMLQDRGPITLRVNLRKSTVAEAQTALRAEGIETAINPTAETALTVEEGARKLRNSRAFADGVIELQDAASQAVVLALPAGARMLDFCAGGGGKALAMKAYFDAEVEAHDADAGRMSDLPGRMARAGAAVAMTQAPQGPYDVVLCDAPCSGSGAWRRAPQGKWTLTPARLQTLVEIQDSILAQAKDLVAPGGTLAFATCSVFRTENEDRVASFLARYPGWQCGFSRRFDVDCHGDGFFTAHLTRSE